jgi:hypothetical protein
MEAGAMIKRVLVSVVSLMLLGGYSAAMKGTDQTAGPSATTRTQLVQGDRLPSEMTGYWRDDKYGHGGKLIIRYPAGRDAAALSGSVEFWDSQCGSNDPYPYTGSYSGGNTIALAVEMGCGTVVMQLTKNGRGAWIGNYQVASFSGVLIIVQAR